MYEGARATRRYVLSAGLLDTLEATRRTLDVLVAGETEREGGLMAIEGWKTEPLKSEHRERSS